MLCNEFAGGRERRRRERRERERERGEERKKRRRGGIEEGKGMDVNIRQRDFRWWTAHGGSIQIVLFTCEQAGTERERWEGGKGRHFRITYSLPISLVLGIVGYFENHTLFFIEKDEIPE